MTTTNEPTTSRTWLTISTDGERKTIHDLNVYLRTYTSDAGTPFTNGYAINTWMTLRKNTERAAGRLVAIAIAKGYDCSKSGLYYRLKCLGKTFFFSKKNINAEWLRITSLMDEMFRLPKRRKKSKVAAATDAPPRADDNASTGDFFTALSRRMDATDSPTVDINRVDSSTLDWFDVEVPFSMVSGSSPKLEEFSDNASTVDFFTEFSPTQDYKTGGSPIVEDCTAEVANESYSKLDKFTDHAYGVYFVTGFSHKMDDTESPTCPTLDLRGYVDSSTSDRHNGIDSSTLDRHNGVDSSISDRHNGVDSPTLDNITDGSSTLDDFTPEDTTDGSPKLGEVPTSADPSDAFCCVL